MSGAGEGRARVLAPAKINPRLELLGRRPDGYHEVRTWMVALAPFDRLDVQRTADGAVALRVRGEHATADVPSDGTNLAWRAAEAALELARRTAGVPAGTGVLVELEKNIPSQAGLGGASSDAAAAFLGCERALDVALDPDLRRAALARLGSDCVFFADAVATGVALCEGRGERVRRAPAIDPAWSVALITPDVGCATARVYAALENPLSRSGETHSLPLEVFRTRARDARRWLHNDLERAALLAEPRLRAWREAVDAAGGDHFLLSGSGSSFFGVFDDAREGRAALAAVERESRARGLAARGSWLTQPCGWSLKFLSET